MLNETQLKAILILLDDKGHAGWELAKHLDVSASYLNPILKDLRNSNLIYQGEHRVSKREAIEHGDKESNRKEKEPGGKKRKGYVELAKMRKGDYKEIPFYIVRDLNSLETIVYAIKNFKLAKRPQLISGFIIKVIMESEYVKNLSKSFQKKEIDKVVREVLGWHHDYFTDSYLGEAEKLFDRMTISGKEDAILIKGLRSPFTRDLQGERPLTDLDHWYSDYLKKIQSNEADSMHNSEDV